VTKFNLSSNSAERLRKKWKKEGDFWTELARSHDDVVETVETAILRQIWEALGEAGIKTVPNWPNGQPQETSKGTRPVPNGKGDQFCLRCKERTDHGGRRESAPVRNSVGFC
jgi:hypothetical protein